MSENMDANWQRESNVASERTAALCTVIFLYLNQ